MAYYPMLIKENNMTNLAQMLLIIVVGQADSEVLAVSKVVLVISEVLVLIKMILKTYLVHSLVEVEKVEVHALKKEQTLLFD